MRRSALFTLALLTAGQEQLAPFLATGMVVDTCDGVCAADTH